MESTGSMRITNKTCFPLEIQLAQVGPLYYDLVLPDDVFYKDTGAVHFSINERINTTGHSDTMEKDILPIFKSIIHVIASTVEFGIAVGEASVATSSPYSKVGASLKLAQVMAEVAVTGVEMISRNYHFTSPGWYAGYKHDLEIHFENGIWKIIDVKYNRCFML